MMCFNIIILREFSALVDYHFWWGITLVPRKPNVNLVGCKWIFKINWKLDGIVELYNARLVAKGFPKQPDIDYGDTYNPFVKPTKLRIVLSITVASNWCIRQLDAQNALLHGYLHEDVFMVQSPGYVHSSFSYYVCYPNKYLYGLK